MASLIPAIGVCISRMTGGEKRLAYRLESKLEADWLIWYDVPLGPRNVHPDFVVFNPHRGLLVLEVKDWRLETIQEIDRQSVTLLTPNGLKRQVNPLEQARQYAHEVRRPPQARPATHPLQRLHERHTVKFLTMHSCNGLEFPLVAIPGAGRAVNEVRKDEEARLVYVAMTRATRELVVVEYGQNLL